MSRLDFSAGLYSGRHITHSSKKKTQQWSLPKRYHNKNKQKITGKAAQYYLLLPPGPLAISPSLAREGLPQGGGGWSRNLVKGRGDCKGISRQNVVPFTDASKENTRSPGGNILGLK